MNLTLDVDSITYRRIESDGEEAEGTIDMGIDEVDYFGNTALHSACRKDDAGTAKMLLDMGASQFAWLHAWFLI